MTFLHCADLHLGRRPVGGLGEYSRKRYEDFFRGFDRIIDTALSEQVKLILIAGDLFDRRELGPQILEESVKRLRRIREAGIEVLVTEGNHDNINQSREMDSWLLYLEGEGLLRRLYCTADNGTYTFPSLRIDELTFYGAGYPGAFVDETLTALAATLDGTARNIILVHTAVAREDFLPGTVQPETLDLLRGKAEYIAGGHFHSYAGYPQADPFFFIPGCPEYWDLGEQGKRGCILYDTETRTRRFSDASPRRRIELEMEVTSGTPEDFRQAFTALLRATPLDPGEDILLIRIRNHRPFFIDTAWCEAEAEKAGALKTLLQLRYPEESERAAEEGLLSTEAEEERIIAGWEFFGTNATLVTAALQHLKRHQEANDRGLFLEAFDGMIETLLGEGKDSA